MTPAQPGHHIGPAGELSEAQAAQLRYLHGRGFCTTNAATLRTLEAHAFDLAEARRLPACTDVAAWWREVKRGSLV